MWGGGEGREVHCRERAREGEREGGGGGQGGDRYPGGGGGERVESLKNLDCSTPMIEKCIHHPPLTQSQPQPPVHTHAHTGPARHE